MADPGTPRSSLASLLTSVTRVICRFLPWLSAPFFFLEIIAPYRLELNWASVLVLLLLGYAALLAVIFIHELGHFVAAKLAGIEIQQFAVGGGHRLQFDARTTLWSFGIIPAHGYVTPSGHQSPSSISFYRQAFFVAGGLLAQVCLLVALGAYLYKHLPLPTADVIDYGKWYVCLTAFIFGVGTAVRNIIPATAIVNGSIAANDGLLLHQLWHEKEDFPRRRAEFTQLELIASSAAGQGTQATAEALARFCRENPKGFQPLFVASYHLSDKNDLTLARAFLEASLTLAPDSLSRVTALDSLACLSIYHAHWAWLEDAERWIREARELDPEKITLYGTLGSVLAERGKTEDAQGMLTIVFDKSTAALDQAISAAYLAKLAHQRGDAVGAKAWLKKALDRDPGHVVIKRIREELSKA